MAEDVVLREVEGLVDRKGGDECTEEVIGAGFGGVGETKEGMIGEAPGRPGEGGWEGFRGGGEVRVEV